ncbi:MAG: O-antigen ligase family protein [Thermodesulfobacteriota bacterium]
MWKNLGEANPFRQADTGSKIVWGAFVITCLHMTVHQPYVIVVPNVGANIFSSLVATAALVAALVCMRRQWKHLASYEIWMPLVLAAIAAASSYYSDTRFISSIRAFVIFSTMLAGYWTSRLLMNTEEGRRFFTWLCLGLLLVTLIQVLAGVILTRKIHTYADPHWHQTAARLLLLAFAPLALLRYGSRRSIQMGLLFLVLTYLGLCMGGYFNWMASVVVIPVILCIMALVLLTRNIRTISVLAAVLVVGSTAVGYYILRHAWDPEKKFGSVAFRAENIVFSVHLAMTRPLLGIGLWAPREKYIEDHEIRFPDLSRDLFTKWVRDLRTSENMFLTFLADLGIPFVILYFGALMLIVWRLIRLTLHPPDSLYPHPIALLLPISGEMLHLMVSDGLFQPQVSWFFHVLLGMAMCGSDHESSESRGS